MKRPLLLLLSLLFITALHARKMIVATYNLRYDNKADRANGNGWDSRCPIIANTIVAQHVDILGTQEGLSNQLEDLRKRWPGYAYIGVGRDDGKAAGEHSAIFYKAEKYQLLAHGDFWLSTITDRPNKGWDAALPRICTWGKFREGKSGFTFYCFNLHMDHVGVAARRESAKLMIDTIRKMAGNMPVMLMGDFNVDQHDTTYDLLQSSALVQDAFILARNRLWTNGTFNNFDTARHTDSRIDHIFLNAAFSVRQYTIPVITYKDTISTALGLPAEASKKVPDRFPSDHHPVIAVLEY